MNRPEQPPIPDHRLFGLIASGAYGEVWLGSNALGTLRAVKIVRRDQHLSLESFEREFKGLQKFEPVRGYGGSHFSLLMWNGRSGSRRRSRVCTLCVPSNLR